MTEAEWGHVLLVACYVIGSLALLDLAAILILTIYTERKAPRGKATVLPARQRAGGPGEQDRPHRGSDRRYDSLDNLDG